MWQELIETLDTLGEVYDKLVALGERKRSALVVVDLKALSNILDEEQLLAAKIQKLEQKRLALLKELSQSDKTLTAATKPKDFYRKAPTPAAQKKLLELHARLSKSVDHVLTIRNNNQILAQCALDAVQGQLNRLSGAAIEPTYSGKGAGIVTHQKKFDFKA